MLKVLFEKQAKSLKAFYAEIDVALAEGVLNKLSTCSGTLVFTGVGKSGYIAQKISATCVSTGTRSTFLCPTKALHGDLGVLSSKDFLICLSNSGESQELIDLLPYARAKGAFTIGVVSKKSSSLAKSVDMAMVLPSIEELCPFDLAPTTSTTTQLLFGDAIAIALMERKQFSIKDFAANHPAGALGRKITLKVADLMLAQERLPICKGDARLIETLHDLSSKQCGCLLVCDEKGSLKGIFTDGDLRRAIERIGAKALEMHMNELMSVSPQTISSDFLAIDAIHKMEEDSARLISVLPVVDGEKIVGLLRMHDIIQAGIK